MKAKMDAARQFSQISVGKGALFGEFSLATVATGGIANGAGEHRWLR